MHLYAWDALRWHQSVVDLGALSVPFKEHILCLAAESSTDAALELSVPFWIEADDITVDILPNSLHVNVRNELDLRRACWQNR